MQFFFSILRIISTFPTSLMIYYIQQSQKHFCTSNHFSNRSNQRMPTVDIHILYFCLPVVAGFRFFIIFPLIHYPFTSPSTFTNKYYQSTLHTSVYLRMEHICEIFSRTPLNRTGYFLQMRPHLQKSKALPSSSEMQIVYEFRYYL